MLEVLYETMDRRQNGLPHEQCTCTLCVLKGPNRPPVARTTRWNHAKADQQRAVQEITDSDCEQPQGDNEVKDEEALPARLPQQHEFVDRDAFARDMVLLVVNHGIPWDGATKILKLVNLHVHGRELQTPLPASTYTLKKLSKCQPGHTQLIALCPHCDFVFNKGQAVCDPCGLPPRKREKRKLMVHDVADSLKHMYGNVKLAEALGYAATRVPGDGDVWDGRVLKDVPTGTSFDVV